MKEHPILFSTEMVKAIIAGSKTQTRRIVKPHPDDSWFFSENNMNDDVHLESGKEIILPPYGQKGDILWVRETFFLEKYFNGLGESFIPLFKSKFDGPVDWNWKPSIHMPKWCARIWLQIESIKVERLQDITEEDAIAEGVERLPNQNGLLAYRSYLTTHEKQLMPCFPYVSYRTLWQKIHGRESWDLNPWVWVITFKVLSITGKPETSNEQLATNN